VRSIGVVTVGRSDYGIVRPVMRRIQAANDLDLALFVSGAHLLEEHGSTLAEIEADGFAVSERIPMLSADDDAGAVAAGLGRGVAGFADAFERRRPDLLVIVGDRLEMLAPVAAAVPFTIPIAHVHGGEITEGSFDDGIRHAISKLSHLHFVSTAVYGRRLRQMGEEAWRVVVSGAPALDEVTLADASLPAGIAEPFLLVTWHPVTLAPDSGAAQLDQLTAALKDVDAELVVTHPNADPGRAAVVDSLERLARERSGVHVLPNAGGTRYFGLMRRAQAMVGNSSSGIVEAASFRLPVVNVGDRQRGRVRPANVIDAEPTRDAIAAAIDRARSTSFREGLEELENPYGDGHASERIVETLRSVSIDRDLLVKRFVDTT
jgi:UDP-hydrolysing UDP-N-acetyl-D-glucosamine 2-epimerase